MPFTLQESDMKYGVDVDTPELKLGHSQASINFKWSNNCPAKRQDTMGLLHDPTK